MMSLAFVRRILLQGAACIWVSGYAGEVMRQSYMSMATRVFCVCTGNMHMSRRGWIGMHVLSTRVDTHPERARLEYII